jgi:hypothetical protein
MCDETLAHLVQIGVHFLQDGFVPAVFENAESEDKLAETFVENN